MPAFPEMRANNREGMTILGASIFSSGSMKIVGRSMPAA
jgi:hypothetical protein